jgi:hypothetical protein
LKAAILIACMLAVMHLPTSAEDAVPEVLMEAAVSTVGNRRIDILGISPGMTVEQVRAALDASVEGEVEEDLQRTVLSHSGIRVTGSPFIRQLAVETEQEEIEIEFSGISSGNQAILVKRDAIFEDPTSAPIFDDVVASLVEKFGEPSIASERMDQTTMLWMFKDGNPARCQRQGTPQCLDPESALMVAEQSLQYFDVIVFAAVRRSDAASDRVGILRQSSTDVAIAVAAEAADVAGLQPALDAAVASSIAGATQPRL